MKWHRTLAIGMGLLFAVHSLASPMREEWATRFGTSQADDIRAMALDASGNTYVAGMTGTNSVLLKIDPNGRMLWSGYFGQGISSSPSVVQADKAQNVVWCGWVSLSRTNSAAFAIKYDSQGTPLWTNLFPGMSAAVQSLVLDSEGSAILATTSYSSGGAQVLEVRKVDPSGQVQWLWTFDSSEGGFMWLAGMAVDASDGVILAGDFSLQGETTGFLAKLNRGGALMLRSQLDFRPRAMALSAAGVIALAGAYDNASFAVTALQPTGETIWTRRYRGPIGHDIPETLAVDPRGNVVVTGRSDGYPTLEAHGRDYLTLKYDSMGRHLWTARYDGGAFDEARNVILDQNGNVYVVGNGPLLKYNPDGFEVWAMNQIDATLLAWGDALIVGDIDLSQLQQTGRDFVIRKFVPDTVAGPPRMVRPPTTQRVPISSNAVFSVLTEGDGPMRYQWHFNDRWASPFSGLATGGPSLIITNVSPQHLGEYWVEVLNVAGLVASPVIRLETFPQLSVGESKSNLVVFGNFTYNYTLESSTNLREWSWRSDFVPFNGRWGIPLAPLSRTNRTIEFFRAVEHPEGR